jgi:ABC-type transport system substrate-binding protein
VHRRLVITIVLAALVAGACTGGKKSSTSAGNPRKGGVLRVGVTSDSSLDPAQARTVEQLLVADQLFDGLTAYDAKAAKVVPALASRWTASPDQKQWDFFLRSDAKFSNGRAITSTDVKYTVDRIAKKGSGSPGMELFEPVSGYSDVALKGALPELAGVTAPSPDVVHFALDQPYAELASALTSPVVGVVPKESVEAVAPADVFAKNPVGSGPFAVKSRTGNRIVLTRAPGSKAMLAGIDLLGYDGVAASYAAFKNDELDWSQVPPEEVAPAGAKYGSGGFVPYAAELFYGFNLKSTKFADVRFRNAIVQAIDRRALVKAIYDDIYKPLDGIVVGGIPGYIPNACGDTCAHNVEKAKAAVAAVFPSGAPEVNLDYDAGEIRDALAKAIQADLKDVGISAVLRPKPFNDYLNFEVSGQQELFLLGWIAAFPSADAFLGPLFVSTSRNNLVGFNRPAFDTALKAARAEPDDTRRQAAYRDAEKIVLGESPVIPILQYEVHSVSAKRVGGLQLSPTGTFDGAKVWVAS